MFIGKHYYRYTYNIIFKVQTRNLCVFIMSFFGFNSPIFMHRRSIYYNCIWTKGVNKRSHYAAAVEIRVRYRYILDSI